MEDSLPATKEIQTPGSDSPTPLDEQTPSSLTPDTRITFTLDTPGIPNTIDLIPPPAGKGEPPVDFKDVRFILIVKKTPDADEEVSPKVRTNVPNNTIRFILQG
jgi:hypothetical protein